VLTVNLRIETDDTFDVYTISASTSHAVVRRDTSQGYPQLHLSISDPYETGLVSLRVSILEQLIETQNRLIREKHELEIELKNAETERDCAQEEVALFQESMDRFINGGYPS
jgi:hypothetical protein